MIMLSRALIGARSVRAAPFVATTWDPATKSGFVTLSGGNLIATQSGSSSPAGCRSVISKSAGKVYFEITVGQVGNTYPSIGVIPPAAVPPGQAGGPDGGWGLLSDGRKYMSSTPSSYGASYGNGTIVGCALDFGLGYIWWSSGGVYPSSGDPAAGLNPAFTGVTGPVHAAWAALDAGPDPYVTANFGATPFSYPPVGFTGWG